MTYRLPCVREKDITYDFVEHYLHARPVLYKGHSFVPQIFDRVRAQVTRAARS